MCHGTPGQRDADLFPQPHCRFIEDLTVSGQGQGCISDETNGTWYFPQDFSKAYVGWESYQKDDPREVWIDDVALSTQPIACPPPGTTIP